MKKLLIILSFIFIIIPINSNALVQKSDKIYVTDQAKIITKNTEDYIVNYSTFLKENNNIDYYVVTVKSLEGNDIEIYANYVYETFNISNKGILILLSKDDRIVYVKVGNKLSSFITDETINNYIEYFFMPYLKKEEWSNGIRNGYSSFYKLICNHYNIDSSVIEVHDGNDIINNYKVALILLIIWISTTLCYAFCKYFQNLATIKKINLKDHLIFMITLFTNILILAFTYYIDPKYILIVTGFELLEIVAFFQVKPKTKKKTTNKKKVTRKH